MYVCMYVCLALSQSLRKCMYVCRRTGQRNHGLHLRLCLADDGRAHDAQYAFRDRTRRKHQDGPAPSHRRGQRHGPHHYHTVVTGATGAATTTTAT